MSAQHCHGCKEENMGSGLRIQEWRWGVWQATESATQRNVEAAERTGSNLGEWAAGVSRAFKGACQLQRLTA